MISWFNNISSGWVVFAEVLYILLLVVICLRVVYDTGSTTKTLAYLLIIIFLPFIGIFIYFSFGINYRKRKMYSKKLIQDDVFRKELRQGIIDESEKVKTGSDFNDDYGQLYQYLLNEGRSPLTDGNDVSLLINGEEKFPQVYDALKNAKHHIHIEYYIYEADPVGEAVADILITKAKEGVAIRFIYDDFGSLSLSRKLIKKLKEGGVHTYPFYKIKIMALANRLNYRNHRKIIVIDGKTGFVGGINVSKKYVNDAQYNNKLFWRDTHLKLKGPAVYQLQYIFLTDWNYCAKDNLHPTSDFFPSKDIINQPANKLAQCAASGPDSDNPTIMYSILQAISIAKKEILLTTPYFIPGESILEALIVASYSGVKVRMLVPGISDSKLVNNASNSYYNFLLEAGVEIYKYRKGFVHAKTLVIDRCLMMVGTANMDHRSFDLNFEINAVVYDKSLAEKLADVFEQDIKEADKIDPDEWKNRPMYRQLIEKICRLVSPML